MSIHKIKLGLLSMSLTLCSYSNANEKCFTHYSNTVKTEKFTSLISNQERVQQTLRVILPQLDTNRIHQSVISSFVLKQTESIIQDASNFNEKDTKLSLNIAHGSTVSKSFRNLQDLYYAELSAIKNLAEKKFSLATKRMKANSLEKKIATLKSLDESISQSRASIVNEISMLKNKMTTIEKYILSLERENDYISTLITSLTDYNAHEISSELFLKSYMINNLISIFQQKKSALELLLISNQQLHDSSYELVSLGFQNLREGSPKLQELFSILNQRNAAMEKERQDRLIKEEKQKEAALLQREQEKAQALEKERRRIETYPERKNNIEKNLDNALKISSNFSSQSKIDNYLYEFYVENYDVLTPNLIPNLVRKLNSERVREQVLRHHINYQILSISLKDFWLLFKLIPSERLQKDVLISYATTHASNLTTEELISLALKSPSQRAADEILSLH
ncbi:MAG: hypothetical protein L6Q37_06850 [Bdellovibrionaceae bacterium]|nr:hypothetical protein [Pseudobdellovibrionaceae bacterium]NUM59767.1 hypothetical protein [Pseudobdellovibrionaceae bacterium]